MSSERWALAPDGAVGPPDPATRALAHWIAGRIDGAAADAADAIWAELASYRGSDLRADVIAHCRRIYGVFVTTLEEGRHPRVDDFQWTAEHALRRVEHDISLIDFLKAFRIAQLTLWQHVLLYTRRADGSQETALALVSHLMLTIEAASSAAATTYLEAQQYDLADHERVRRDLIEDLLAGRPPAAAPRLTTLRDAGICNDLPFAVGTVRVAGTGDAGTDSLAVRARNSLSQVAGGIFVLRQGELVALIPLRGSSEAQLMACLETGVQELHQKGLSLSVGLSAQHTELASVPEAYAESQTACDSLEDAQGVACISTLSTLDYLMRRPDETARRLIRAQVRAFFSDDLAHDGVSSESLRAYISHDLNAREAAKALHVHVNTMYYRLERIAAGTGSNLRRIDDVIDLLLAVQILGKERAYD